MFNFGYLLLRMSNTQEVRNPFIYDLIIELCLKDILIDFILSIHGQMILLNYY